MLTLTELSLAEGLNWANYKLVLKEHSIWLDGVWLKALTELTTNYWLKSTAIDWTEGE
jgi:hypothetical protein